MYIDSLIVSPGSRQYSNYYTSATDFNLQEISELLKDSGSNVPCISFTNHFYFGQPHVGVYVQRGGESRYNSFSGWLSKNCDKSLVQAQNFQFQIPTKCVRMCRFLSQFLENTIPPTEISHFLS